MAGLLHTAGDVGAAGAGTALNVIDLITAARSGQLGQALARRQSMVATPEGAQQANASPFLAALLGHYGSRQPTAVDAAPGGPSLGEQQMAFRSDIPTPAPSTAEQIARANLATFPIRQQILQGQQQLAQGQLANQPLQRQVLQGHVDEIPLQQNLLRARTSQAQQSAVSARQVGANQAVMFPLQQELLRGRIAAQPLQQELLQGRVTALGQQAETQRTLRGQVFGDGAPPTTNVIGATPPTDARKMKRSFSVSPSGGIGMSLSPEPPPKAMRIGEGTVDPRTGKPYASGLANGPNGEPVLVTPNRQGQAGVQRQAKSLDAAVIAYNKIFGDRPDGTAAIDILKGTTPLEAQASNSAVVGPFTRGGAYGLPGRPSIPMLAQEGNPDASNIVSGGGLRAIIARMTGEVGNLNETEQKVVADAFIPGPHDTYERAAQKRKLFLATAGAIRNGLAAGKLGPDDARNLLLQAAQSSDSGDGTSASGSSPMQEAPGGFRYRIVTPPTQP